MLVLEGLQYTGFRSGSPFTRKVYCGTAGALFPAQQIRNTMRLAIPVSTWHGVGSQGSAAFPTDFVWVLDADEALEMLHLN